jgi:hypothetical protein
MGRKRHRQNKTPTRKQPADPAATRSLPAAADRSAVPQTTEDDRAPESLDHWFMLLIWRSRWRKAILAGLALLVSGTTIYPVMTWLREQLPHSHPFPADPVVISVQPKGEFGDLRADGLTRGLNTTSSLGVVRITADIRDMKARDVDEMMSELRKRIAEHNAIALVGPSISECTVDILDCVQSSGVPLPVIIESSSPREQLRWDTRPFPLFRLSSGIDERAVEVAQVARRLLDSGATVAFLVERVPNAESYGELLHKYTRRHLDTPTLQRIQIHYFDHSHAGKIVSQPQIMKLFASDAVVFLFGIGNDFHAVMDAFLRNESRPTRVRLTGIMCAYRTAPSLLGGGYRRSQVIELTDMSPQSPDQSGNALQVFQSAYGSGQFDPAVRDQAFSFDAGLCLAEAMRHVLDVRRSKPGMTYEDAIRDAASHLMNTSMEGVSGRVEFRRKGTARGQNYGSALQLARMDDQGHWRPITIEQILDPSEL